MFQFDRFKKKKKKKKGFEYHEKIPISGIKQQKAFDGCCHSLRMLYRKDRLDDFSSGKK